MKSQAFELLMKRLDDINTDVKDDIKDLRKDINIYKAKNNEVVTRLRVSVGQLMVVAGITGFGAGFGGSFIKEKIFLKQEKAEFIKSNNNNPKGD